MADRMRVKPPGDGPPPIFESGETAPAAPVAPTEQTRAAESTKSISGVAPASAASGAAAADPVLDVSRRLRAGEITAQQALELLIDGVVARHVQAGGQSGDRERLAGDLKQLLQKHAESDPYLASKVRRMGNRS